MVKKNFFLVILFFIFQIGVIFAEEPLPSGYGGIQLGMSIEDVKKALKANPDFGYNGDSDVSLLPGENRKLIETDTERIAPGSYLSRCWFQFYNDKLYIMIINMNSSKIDHYSIFTTLCKKYGDPDSLSPEKAVWQGDHVLMSLESPLSVKYIDRQVFEKLQKESLVKKSAGEITKQMFLEGL